jgi:hypothetical protein
MHVSHKSTCWERKENSRIELLPLSFPTPFQGDTRMEPLNKNETVYVLE